ncbi:MAG: Tetracycline resistance protein class [Verrucomicrobiota bacterium]|jgi:DHA1 family tetracycline resistance protein-like MFS transporter
MSPARSPLFVIFLTVFISMVGFGIVIPVLPVYAKQPPFLLGPAELGWLVGIFSLVQLVFAPVFGRISDRIGRKPVLLFSVIGTAVGFFVIGRAEAAWMLFLGRVIDGASGGNIGTAQACVADVTPPDRRSKAMGMIGVAFGLGFIMGPALGGLLASYSHSAPFYFAGALSVANALLIWLRLPETYPAEKRALGSQRATLGELFAGQRASSIGLLLLASLLSTTGFAFIHVLFALFCGDRFQWSLRETSYAFAYVGILAVFVQGGLLRRLLNRNIEKQIAIFGAFTLAISLFWLPRVHGVSAFMGSCALMALGNGLLTPTLTGMASRCVSGSAQGRLMGLMTSAGSLGRFLGPALAVIPLPLNFSSLGRPLTGDVLPVVDHGYAVSFSVGAALVGASILCVGLLRLPKPESAA